MRLEQSHGPDGLREATRRRADGTRYRKRTGPFAATLTCTCGVVLFATTGSTAEEHRENVRECQRGGLLGLRLQCVACGEVVYLTAPGEARQLGVRPVQLATLDLPELPEDGDDPAAELRALRGPVELEVGVGATVTIIRPGPPREVPRSWVRPLNPKPTPGGPNG